MSAARATAGDRSLRRRLRDAALVAAALVYFAALVIVPLVALARAMAPDGFGRVIADVSLLTVVSPLVVTLVIATLATAANVVFGTAVACVLVREETPGRRILDALVTLSFFVAPIVAGYAILLAAAPDSRVGAGADAAPLPPWLGLSASAAFASFPLFVRALEPSLARLRSEADDTTRIPGASGAASGWAGFWRVTVPGVRWGFARAVALSFACACGALGAFVGVTGAAPTGPRAATYAALEANRPGARTLVLLLLALAIALFAVARWAASLEQKD